MLGTEPQIVSEYINAGQVRLTFMPMLDHGPPSQNTYAAAHCAGLQNATAFWQMHDFLFANFGQLRSADKAYFADAAASFDLDRTAFESCYDSGAGHVAATDLDNLRKQQGIFNRPTFDINGLFLFGNQSFTAFQEAFAAQLP